MAGRPRWRTIGAVQQLVLGAIASMFVLTTIVGAVYVLERRGRVTPLQLVLGLGAGLVGAFFVLVARTDLVPDGPDDLVERVIIVGVTIAVVLGSWVRIARV